MSKEIATNRKALRDFHIGDRYQAGIELRGTEVKSVRAGKVNLADAFVRVDDGQAVLFGCDIQPWETAGEYFQHAAKRPRRLLLHKREIAKLYALVKQDGYALIPLSVYFKEARVKIELGVCKGKKNYDKREDAARKDAKRQIDRAMKGRN